MSVDIICPLFNAEKYLENLHHNILQQKNVNIKNIYYVLTESQDNTEEILKKNKFNYKKISKTEFSHSLVREEMAFNSNADIVVFITQDIIPKNENWLYYLTKDISEEIVACYSKQISKTNGIEKYTREKNYPNESFVVSKKDLEKLGLKTFFFSDASSAIKREIFLKLNGYDQKDLPISEDMYIAYKIIMNNFKIKYCSESIIIHSHNYKLKELYKRYKLTGRFFKENSYLDKYGTNQSGASLALYILKRAMKEHNFRVIFRYPFDMLARFIGMKAGKM